MVDSHCHLDFPDYQADFESVLERTRTALEFVVNVGTDLRASERAVELAQAYPFIYASVGVHPHDAATVTAEVTDRLRTLVAATRVVAIGECGLDYTANTGDADKEVQKQAFQQQLKLADEAKLPVIIHCREAYDDLLTILRAQVAPPRGVVHCFLGNKNQAQAFLDLGWYLSFTGIITFKNAAPELLEVVRETPLERMLVETDAPFLTPVPYRGKRNEPAYVVEVAKKIAELKAITVEEVDRATSDAARAVFLSAKSVVQ
jgi:TatD DNase family protein